MTKNSTHISPDIEENESNISNHEEQKIDYYFTDFINFIAHTIHSNAVQ